MDTGNDATIYLKPILAFSLAAEMSTSISPLVRKGASYKELCGTLYNSEVWCNYSESNFKQLGVRDRKILRCILGAHSKSPREMLYLETNLVQIPYIVSTRRLMYYQNILKKQSDEIVKKFFWPNRIALVRRMDIASYGGYEEIQHYYK